MDHLPTEHGLRLTYLHDAESMADLDQDRILEDMSDDSPEGDPLPWLTRYRLADYDHLVLATDRFSGRYMGFLAVNDGATTREPFLLLETAFVASSARGQNLVRQMIGLAMLRIGALGPVPSVIVSCTHNPLCYRIMRDVAQRIAGAVFFPNPDDATINFRAATLAQRIARELAPNHRFLASTGTMRGTMMMGAGVSHHGALAPHPRITNLSGQSLQPAERMLAVIDLRGADEASILDDARRVYRSK